MPGRMLQSRKVLHIQKDKNDAIVFRAIGTVLILDIDNRRYIDSVIICPASGRPPFVVPNLDIDVLQRSEAESVLRDWIEMKLAAIMKIIRKTAFQTDSAI